MSKPSEIKKRRIVLADGRYLIFFAFAPAEIPAPRQRAIAETEENQKFPGKER